MDKPKILVVEDDSGLREALTDTLALAQYHVLGAESAEAAILLLKKHAVQLVVSDVQLGAVSGISLLKTLREHHAHIPVLLMTAYANVQDAVVAIQNGAVNYLAKPFSPEVLVSTVARYLKPDISVLHAPVAASAESKQLIMLAERVANSDANVMILGPSGAGKEVLARYIHQQSSRASAPFVAINCAAIPDNMLEASLFGYEKGAFTGAVAACPGKFEQAQGGTLLLDEVTEMPLNLQVKLLRVLQEREVERLGGRKLIKLDVRILATSNRDLRHAVAAGILREDLYYRLNVFPLVWPALAQRPADIVPLARHLLEKHCRTQHRAVPDLVSEAQMKLTTHRWPGNVRELDNVIQRALILQRGNVIQAADILLECHDSSVSELAAPRDDDGVGGETVLPWTQPVGRHHAADLAETVTDFKAEIHEQEHKLILATLKACAYKRKEAAQRLGMSDRTLRYKLARMRERGIALHG